MRRSCEIAGPLSLAAVLLASGLCLADDAPTSKKLDGFTYKETSGRVTLILGAQLAAINENEPFVPLQIAAGVRGKGQTLVLTRASFLLFDARGGAHTLAPVEEVVASGLISANKRIAATAAPLNKGLAFLDMPKVGSNFYPATGKDVGTERIELGPRTYFSDIIYFPRPEEGLDGTLTLQFVARGLREPIRVTFAVPDRKKD